jgi:hypothetical protein
MLTYHAQVNMSYHKLTCHAYVNYLQHVKYVKLKQRSKLKMRRKGRKKTLSDEPTVPSVQASVHLVHNAEAEKIKMLPSDEPTVQFLDAPDELQRSSKDSSTK